MGTFQVALRLSKEALDLGFTSPLMNVWALGWVGLILAWVVEKPFRDWKPYQWFVFSHALFFAAIIFVGASLSRPPTLPPFPEQRRIESYLAILGYCSWASCVFWVWSMKGFRWFAVSLCALMQLPVMIAFLIAGNSVSLDAF